MLGISMSLTAGLISMRPRDNTFLRHGQAFEDTFYMRHPFKSSLAERKVYVILPSGTHLILSVTRAEQYCRSVMTELGLSQPRVGPSDRELLLVMDYANCDSLPY